MALCLHNPASEAHLEELKDRLLSELGCAPWDVIRDGSAHATVEGLLDLVRSMDKGTTTTKEALETFTRHGFSDFGKWLVDMVDEGVYLDTRLDKAARRRHRAFPLESKAA